MICDKCKKIIVCHAFANTKCKCCEAPIYTGHIPGYKVCNDCSDKHKICQQCGGNINDRNN